MIKNFILFTFLICDFAFSQDVASLLKNHEEKAYNPKFQALTDLVVDIESPSITKQLNDQMILGFIKNLYFRIYWTASPERVAVEIHGLPDGFNEIKNELKQSILSKFETVVPISLEKKFNAYKLSVSTRNKKIIIAKDEKGLSLIPEYELEFGPSGVLSRVKGKKPVGMLETSFELEKSNWSEPRYYIKKTILNSIDGPQSLKVESETEWQIITGIGLPLRVNTITTQTITVPGSREQKNKIEEILIFKNTKVNLGEALKWFLANSTN